jgi:hypothetical protein
MAWVCLGASSVGFCAMHTVAFFPFFVFQRACLCTNMQTSNRLYARNGVGIVKRKIRENLSFRLFAFLRWLFAETSQNHCARITFLFLHIGLQNGMSDSTLKQNDEIESEKSVSRPGFLRFRLDPAPLCWLLFLLMFQSSFTGQLCWFVCFCARVVPRRVFLSFRFFVFSPPCVCVRNQFL